MPHALSFLHVPPTPAPFHPFRIHRTQQYHPHLSLRTRNSSPAAAAAAEAENPSAPAGVEMVRGRDGVWTARSTTVVVLWDLDNKPPRGPPFPAATSLIAASSLLGRVVSVSAFANRHAFSHLPAWVAAERRDRWALDRAERAGVAAPSVPYSCAVCGRRFPTRPDLTRHFRQLHERERNKKLPPPHPQGQEAAKVPRAVHLRQHEDWRSKTDGFTSGSPRRPHSQPPLAAAADGGGGGGPAHGRKKIISGNTKYEDAAARELLTPKVGDGLASELRRAGVHVRTVSDKPQAADHALERQVKHSVTCRVDWMVLVSDDSDFPDTVRNARAADLRTVVVGDGCRALGKVADIWLPWDRVENGEVDEEMLRSCTLPEFGEDQEHEHGEEFRLDWDTSNLDDVVEDIVGMRTSLLGAMTTSAFADDDVTDGIFGVESNGDSMFWSSDDEEEDGYL